MEESNCKLSLILKKKIEEKEKEIGLTQMREDLKRAKRREYNRSYMKNYNKRNKAVMYRRSYYQKKKDDFDYFKMEMAKMREERKTDETDKIVPKWKKYIKKAINEAFMEDISECQVCDYLGYIINAFKEMESLFLQASDYKPDDSYNEKLNKAYVYFINNNNIQSNTNNFLKDLV